MSTATSTKAFVACGSSRAIGLPPRAPASEARVGGRLRAGTDMRLHTRRRDRAVIAHHYDLSNDFYELILDEHMAYSCAYFTSPNMSLYEAQRAKLELICGKLDAQPGARLLDVGCGWGSLSLFAAEHRGARVTGVTLSIAAQQWAGVFTIMSPLLMTWTLTRKTGKPLLEQGMADRRPGYSDYVARMSGFFPLPPKRAV